ncbi:MAG: MoaD/ThiS family protein [Pirellulales bacterium]|nr:MoaD/ThiS family protein [Pirellulales bacterium]
MATIFIPAPLQDLTGGLAEVELEAVSLGEVIARLEARFPGIKDRLCDDDQLSPALQASINHVMTRQMRAEVGPDSEVHFLPAIGGG